MDDACDLAALLGLDGDGEAVATNGDELFLRCACVGERAKGTAEGVLDGAMLALEGAADAGELGTGVVGEAAVRLDLALQGVEERGKVGVEDGLRERGDGRPAGGDGVGRFGSEDAPGFGDLGEGEEVEEVEGFKGGAGDAGLGEEIFGVEDAGEAEERAAGDEVADLVDAVVLEGDPGEVGGGLEGEDAVAADGGGGAASEKLAELWPLERGGAELAKGGGDGFGLHVF